MSKTAPRSKKVRTKAKTTKRNVSPTKSTPAPQLVEAVNLADGLRQLIDSFVITPDTSKSLVLATLKELPVLDESTPHYESLLELISLKRNHYVKFCVMISLGVFPPTAFACCGLRKAELIAWVRCGQRDLNAALDTWCARLCRDIEFYAHLPAADAEAAICRKDPLEWLRSGPGRWLNAEGTWQPGAGNPQPLEVPESTGVAQPIVVSDDDDYNPFENAPTAEDLPAALLVLREVGLSSVVESAEKEADNRHKKNGKVKK